MALEGVGQGLSSMTLGSFAVVEARKLFLEHSWPLACRGHSKDSYMHFRKEDAVWGKSTPNQDKYRHRDKKNFFKLN